MRFELKPVLTDEQWNAVDKTALDILEKVGIQVPHSVILEELRGKKGVQINGEIVRYDRSLVQDQIRIIWGCSGYDTHVMGGAYSHNYLDPQTVH